MKKILKTIRNIIIFPIDLGVTIALLVLLFIMYIINILRGKKEHNNLINAYLKATKHLFKGNEVYTKIEIIIKDSEKEIYNYINCKKYGRN